MRGIARNLAGRLTILFLYATSAAGCAGHGRESQADRSNAAAAIGSGGYNSVASQHKPTVVLISFDAFRWDYPDRGITPNLAALAARGARADGLIPIFPTKTFPNHYAIATGLYADRNGIAGNSFYDPTIDAFYSSKDTLAVRDPRFYGGEPVWVTAERQGMVTGSMYWVGSEAPIRGVSPTLMWPYDRGVADSTRLRALHEWLRRPPETRPHLVAVYFSVIDDTSHVSGPDSPATLRAIAYADSVLGVITRDVATLPETDSVTVVVVSDHGMTDASNWVYIADHMDTTGMVFFGGPVANAHFGGDSTRMKRAYSSLKAVPHTRAYYRSQLPKEWHYDLARAGDIVIVADAHWQVGLTPPDRAEKGFAHGYPPSLRDMQGIFVAAGPRIRAGTRVEAFENIHVYPFVTELLRIQPNRSIDGRAAVLRSILRN